MKTCSDCGTTLPLRAFYKHKSGNPYQYCKACHLTKRNVKRREQEAREKQIKSYAEPVLFTGELPGGAL